MSANNGIFPFQFPCLTMDNYELWSSCITTFSRSQDAWDIVKNGYSKPKNKVTMSPTEKEATTKLKK